MSFPTWPTVGAPPAPTPAVDSAAAAPVAGAAAPSAAAAAAYGAYTPQQFAALNAEQQYAIQQNWQQWQAYQQQYAQWHAQYGEQYQKEMQTKMGTVAPALPASPYAAPPPAYPPAYPPPAPASYSGYPTAAPPPPPPSNDNSSISGIPPQNTSQPPPPPPPDNDGNYNANNNQNNNQQWQSNQPNRDSWQFQNDNNSSSNNNWSGGNQQNYNDRRSFNDNMDRQNNRGRRGRFGNNNRGGGGDGNDDGNNRGGNSFQDRGNRFNDNNYNGNNSNNNNQGRWGGNNNDFNQKFDDQSNNFRSDDNSNRAPDTGPPQLDKDGKSPEEKIFDEQFQNWETEFENWKRANANHPDKKAYREYEMKFEDCRRKLVERREQMKKRKEAELQKYAAQQPSVEPLPPPPMPDVAQIDKEVAPESSNDGQDQPPPPKQRRSRFDAAPAAAPVASEPEDDSFAEVQAEGIQNLVDDEEPQKQPEMSDLFKRSGGIPGLDLVENDGQEGQEKREEVADVIVLDTDSPIKQPNVPKNIPSLFDLVVEKPVLSPEVKKSEDKDQDEANDEESKSSSPQQQQSDLNPAPVADLAAALKDPNLMQLLSAALAKAQGHANVPHAVNDLVNLISQQQNQTNCGPQDNNPDFGGRPGNFDGNQRFGDNQNMFDQGNMNQFNRHDDRGSMDNFNRQGGPMDNLNRQGSMDNFTRQGSMNNLNRQGPIDNFNNRRDDCDDMFNQNMNNRRDGPGGNQFNNNNRNRFDDRFGGDAFDGNNRRNMPFDQNDGNSNMFGGRNSRNSGGGRNFDNFNRQRQPWDGDNFDDDRDRFGGQPNQSRGQNQNPFGGQRNNNQNPFGGGGNQGRFGGQQQQNRNMFGSQDSRDSIDGPDGNGRNNPFGSGGGGPQNRNSFGGQQNRNAGGQNRNTFGSQNSRDSFDGQDSRNSFGGQGQGQDDRNSFGGQDSRNNADGPPNRNQFQPNPWVLNGQNQNRQNFGQQQQQQQQTSSSQPLQQQSHNFNNRSQPDDGDEYFRPAQVIDYQNQSKKLPTLAPVVVDYGHKPSNATSFQPMKTIDYGHASAKSSSQNLNPFKSNPCFEMGMEGNYIEREDNNKRGKRPFGGNTMQNRPHQNPPAGQISGQKTSPGPPSNKRGKQNFKNPTNLNTNEESQDIPKTSTTEGVKEAAEKQQNEKIEVQQKPLEENLDDISDNENDNFDCIQSKQGQTSSFKLTTDDRLDSNSNSNSNSNFDRERFFAEQNADLNSVKAGNRRQTQKIPLQNIFPSVENSNTITIDEILLRPGRDSRPKKIVIILRGPPGSGKSHVAQLIKQKELELGGTTPRILSIDDYFMVENDVEEKCPKAGRKIKRKEMVYEYEAGMEESYMQYLIKSFKKTITDSLFNFIIIDCSNHSLRSFTEFYNQAKDGLYTPYTIDLHCDLETAISRNTHNRDVNDIKNILKNWKPTPFHYIKLDVKSLIDMDENQDEVKSTVDMEDVSDLDDNFADLDEIKDDNDSENSQTGFLKSKWDTDPNEEKLARLDGTRKPFTKRSTIEEYLQIDGWEPPVHNSNGKKRVRWADIEEKREQDKMRAIGFVVGQTDWNRMMDPTGGSGALTKTKFIERVNKRR